MKKTLIALFVAAFCLSSMAQVLIYDYSVSFKRIDVKQVKTTYKNDNVKKTVKLDSPKVVSDKFVGYVVVDACTKCEGQMTESLNEDNTATVLITRKGAKKADKTLYTVENAKFKALMFGAKTGIRTGDEADKINFDKFTDAAAWLDYELSWEKNNNNVGFLGFDNSSSDKMAKQAGYGKVTKRSTKDKTITDCEGTTETIPGVTCWMVKNIAGSFLADTTYTGICSNFLFDVCDLDLETPGTTTDAPLPGTFTLKLNNGLTFNKGAFRYTTKEAAFEALKAKLGF